MPDEAAKPPLLKVTLGESAGSLQAHTPPVLEPLTSEFGQIVNRAHHLQIVAGSLELAPFATLFSSVSYTAGKVTGVETNPQEDYLELAKAAAIVVPLGQKFTEGGFHNDEAKKLAPAFGDKEVVYRGSKDNISCLIVLEKAVPKDSDTGRVAKVTADLYLIHLTVEIKMF